MYTKKLKNYGNIGEIESNLGLKPKC